MEYVMSKKGKKRKVINFDFDMDGYTFIPSQGLGIKNIKIIDEDLVGDILILKFNQNFKQIMQLIITLIDADEDSSDDILMVIGEISRLKSIVLNKYNKYLKENKIRMFLKKIAILESEVKNKLLYLNPDDFSLQEELSNQRSR